MPRAVKEVEEAPKRAPRRRVAKPKAAAVANEEVVAAPRRKAPTQIPSEPRVVRSGGKSMRVYIFGVFLLVGFGAAAAIGYSDAGQININAVVSERNAKLSAGAASATDAGVGDQASGSYTIPVQNTSNLPDGGLNGSVNPTPVPLPPIEEATTTATSTASSTVTDLDEAIDDTGTTSTDVAVPSEGG